MVYTFTFWLISGMGTLDLKERDPAIYFDHDHNLNFLVKLLCAMAYYSTPELVGSIVY